MTSTKFDFQNAAVRTLSGLLEPADRIQQWSGPHRLSIAHTVPKEGVVPRLLINAIRGHCAEFGIIAPHGARRASELVEQIRQAERYDWALLAYAVGFGGSMFWFGSSAAVALTNFYPEGRSVFRWLREGWFLPVAYVAGFAVMLLLLGWNPDLTASAAPPTH